MPKTFKVAVNYIDAQPEDFGTYQEHFLIDAETDFEAEGAAMKKCRDAFAFNEPIDATAVEYCATCYNTGFEPGQEGGLCPDCATKPQTPEPVPAPQVRHERAA